jgi:entericidin A
MLKLMVIAAVMMATLSSCNTTRGFGEDIQHLGGAISRGVSK